ncbi:MAG: hypothetical protein U5P41_09380 [Gammaproteobacteria bacterium]|nr:hypothetical protein [Gammaproteobacteria bacterium]
MISFYQAVDVPVRSIVLMQSREQALHVQRGEIDLVVCPRCGFIQNDCYDPSLQNFTDQAEETQGWSPTFRDYADSLAEYLRDRYSTLQGGTVVEIGCGTGQFLSILCSKSDARGIGIESIVQKTENRIAMHHKP